MESFYQQWLKKNNAENKLARNQFKKQNPQASTSTVNILNPDPVPSTSRVDIHDTEPTPSTSRGIDYEAPSILTVDKTSEPSDIVYEKDGLQLLVQRGQFQRQKKFSLQAKISQY